VPCGADSGIGLKSHGAGGGASEFVDGVAGVVGHPHIVAPSKRIAFRPPTGKVPQAQPVAGRQLGHGAASVLSPKYEDSLPEVSWLFFKVVRAGLAVRRPYLNHTGRASNAEKQPTSRGPEGCVENGSAASLLVSHVQHQFDASPRKPTRYLQTSNWCWMLLQRQSGSDRLADDPF
jgi:hypothetical protein